MGLVPKAGNKTRLIFHLYYDFGPQDHQKSFNHFTPTELCSVKYNYLKFAITRCFNMIEMLKRKGKPFQQIFFGKSDLSNAFRLVPGKISQCQWLMLKAFHLITNELKYFVDMCMPFGVSISCAIFQAFSDALRHIMEWILQEQSLSNYLDDFLFFAFMKQRCDFMINQFLKLCSRIGCPVSLEKTEKATTVIIFLGLLLDGVHLIISIPLDKRNKAISLLNWAVNNRKVTIKFIQSLMGTLNFLSRAVIPGRPIQQNDLFQVES